jgi:hypothetical protein
LAEAVDSVLGTSKQLDLVLSHELEHGGAIALQLALADVLTPFEASELFGPYTCNFGESGVMEDDVGWCVLLGRPLAVPSAQGFKEGNVGRFHVQVVEVFASLR